MTGSDMGSVHSRCFHEGFRNPSWEPYAVSSFYSLFPSFYTEQLLLCHRLPLPVKAECLQYFQA